MIPRVRTRVQTMHRTHRKLKSVPAPPQLHARLIRVPAHIGLAIPVVNEQAAIVYPGAVPGASERAGDLRQLPAPAGDVRASAVDGDASGIPNNLAPACRAMPMPVPTACPIACLGHPAAHRDNEASRKDPESTIECTVACHVSSFLIVIHPRGESTTQPPQESRT